MSFNLNEKCLLNYLCNYGHEQPEVKNNLAILLEDFGVVIKTSRHNNQIYEIIEGYEKIN